MKLKSGAWVRVVEFDIDVAKLRLKAGKELTIKQQINLDLHRVYIESILELLLELRKDIDEIKRVLHIIPNQ
jgi:hypothetical protein